MGATYPGTLPTLDFASISVGRSSNTIRSVTDAGPAKVRRRFTNVPRSYTQRVFLDETQRVTWDSFFDATLASGSLPFDIPEPLDGGTVECRFLEEPTWALVVHHSSTTRQLWSADVSFEVLG